MLAMLLAREAMLGLALGLAVMILLSGMQLAGQIISQTSGMSLADVANPDVRHQRAALLADPRNAGPGDLLSRRRPSASDRRPAPLVRLDAARPGPTCRTAWSRR